MTDALSTGVDSKRYECGLGVQQNQQKAQTFRPTILQHNKNTFSQDKSVSDLYQNQFGSFNHSFYHSATGMYNQPRPAFNSFSVPSFDGQLCGMFKSNLSLNEKDSMQFVDDSTTLVNSNQEINRQSSSLYSSGSPFRDTLQSSLDLTSEHQNTDLEDLNDFFSK